MASTKRVGPNTPIPAALYSKIVERDASVCQYCNRSTLEPTVDHVIPRDWFPSNASASRVNDPSNLVTACFPCNRKKSVLSLNCYAERRVFRGVDPADVAAMVARVQEATKRALPE